MTSKQSIIEAVLREAQKQKTYYHVTRTALIPKIKKSGIMLLQTTNWTKGTGERYGEGDIYACDNLIDAIRWAGKMDWEFNREMGSGKISIVEFVSESKVWKIDQSDPISQAGNKGNWWKSSQGVKPEQIKKVTPVDIEMTRSIVNVM